MIIISALAKCLNITCGIFSALTTGIASTAKGTSQLARHLIALNKIEADEEEKPKE
jgi:hypothetical protein